MATKYRFVMTGKTPLLMHSDNIEGADDLDRWRKDASNKDSSKAGDDRSPAFTWLTYLYQDAGRVVMPGDNIMVSLREAGKLMTLKKQKTFKELTQTGMRIVDPFCTFLNRGKEINTKSLEPLLTEREFFKHREMVSKLGFALYVKRATVGQKKHVRVRPRFDAWSVEGVLDVYAPEFTPSVLAQLWGLAGSNEGMCDWRPGSPRAPGSFGIFEVELKAM